MGCEVEEEVWMSLTSDTIDYVDSKLGCIGKVQERMYWYFCLLQKWKLKCPGLDQFDFPIPTRGHSTSNQ